MKQIAKFLVGSRAFFEGMPEFNSKDHDWLYVMDSYKSVKAKRLVMHKDGNDMILVPKMDKEWYITDCINSDFGISAGKMFVPEFAVYIGLTVNDLKRFEPYLSLLDDKHKYYKVIYEAYMQNGDFTLTDEQREAAYEEYKKYRI
jgi:hypothetical protein